MDKQFLDEILQMYKNDEQTIESVWEAIEEYKKTAEAVIRNPTLQFPEVCHIVNGKNFWLDESLPKEKQEAILQFIKAVTHKKLSGGKSEV